MKNNEFCAGISIKLYLWFFTETGKFPLFEEIKVSFNNKLSYLQVHVRNQPVNLHIIQAMRSNVYC